MKYVLVMLTLLVSTQTQADCYVHQWLKQPVTYLGVNWHYQKDNRCKAEVKKGRNDRDFKFHYTHSKEEPKNWNEK
jgi:hypothetical protein